MKQVAIIFITSTLLVFTVLLNSCKKDEMDETTFVSTVVSHNIAATIGGEVATSDSLRLIIPPNALPEDATVSIGRTGNEPKTVPGKNLKPIALPFTVNIPCDSLNSPVRIRMPMPGSMNTDNAFIVAFNGETYFPFDYVKDGNNIEIILDAITWGEYKAKSSKGATFLGLLIVYVLENMQTPSTIMMGLKQVSLNSAGELDFYAPPTVNANSKILLMVHGWLGDPSGWDEFTSFIKSNSSLGYTNYWTFGYNSSLGIDVNGKTLSDQVKWRANGANIDIVAHSMGGLVSRSAIENHGCENYINSLTTLGTPHLGASLAVLRYVVGGLVLINNQGSYLSYNSKTQGWKDLHTNSAFINQMTSNPSASIPYHAIACENNPGKWPLSHSPYLPGPDDGVVTVNSAKTIAGATSPANTVQIDVGCAHLKMRCNSAIQNQVYDFLSGMSKAPTVSTNPVTNITQTSATTGGNVTSQGSSYITARGVCWSTSPNPTTANNTTSDGTGTGTFTSNITGLSSSTTYYVRAYATNSGGTAYGNEVNFTTTGSTPGTYPPGYVHCDPSNPTAIIDVTNPTTGRTWMDRNLGAAQAATSSTDAASYGDLYQWGRFADGHQCRTSATTTTLSSTDQPGHGNFILAPNTPYDWRSPQNDNLWQGVNGVNNPCPAGYRLPTEVELNAERLSWSSNNAAGAFASPLKLPMAGGRDYSNGSLSYIGSFGYYWSSTVSGAYSRGLDFDSTVASMNGSYRAYGYSVRCLKDY